jgi:hypothetical protein
VSGQLSPPLPVQGHQRRPLVSAGVCRQDVVVVVVVVVVIVVVVDDGAV